MEDTQLIDEAMHRPRVYVAGPYTANPDQCTELAIRVGQQLLDEGFAPFVPHLSHFWHLRYANDYEAWMELDLPWVAQADVVYRIPGASSGADREVALAESRGIPVWQCPEAVNMEGNIADFAAWYKGWVRPAADARAEVVPANDGVPPSIDSALQAVRKVFERKNADYSDGRSWDSNFQDVASQMGFPTPVDAADALIAVKQARLRSLRERGTMPRNESVADTYIDRTVYAVIALALLLEQGAIPQEML